MRSATIVAALALASLLAACDQAKPPSEAEIQAQANAPATTPTPPAATPAAPTSAVEATAAAPTAPAPATVATPSPAAPAAAISASAKPGATPAKTAAPAPPPAPPAPVADLANGQAKFAICKSCHNPTQGGPNGIGPNLFGVTTRKAGSAPGYAYSDPFTAANIGTWTDAKLDSWLTDPRAMVPGTKMIFPGLKDPKDRTDVVAYLHTLK